MKEFKVTINIQARAATIWGILINAGNYPNWDPNITKIEGDIVLGNKITIHTNTNNRAFPVTINELVTSQKMVWSGGLPLGLFKGVRTFTLTDKGDGTVDVTVHEVFSGLLMSLIGRVIPDMQPTFEQFAQPLKEAAERR